MMMCESFNLVETLSDGDHAKGAGVVGAQLISFGNLNLDIRLRTYQSAGTGRFSQNYFLE